MKENEIIILATISKQQQKKSINFCVFLFWKICIELLGFLVIKKGPTTKTNPVLKKYSSFKFFFSSNSIFVDVENIRHTVYVATNNFGIFFYFNKKKQATQYLLKAIKIIFKTSFLCLWWALIIIVYCSSFQKILVFFTFLKFFVMLFFCSLYNIPIN